MTPGPFRRALLTLQDATEVAFDRPFGQAGNPWRHLGGLAFFLYWIVAVTGIYVYIGFDTRVDGAYASVERLSSNAFPLGSLARSLHRYASDAFVLVTLLHLAREWIHVRYAHFRRFSWLTGVLASLVRLQGEDFNANKRAGQVTAQHPFVTSALARISRRAGLVEASTAAEELVQAMTRQRLDAWLARRAAITGGAILGYEGKTDGRTLGLLSKPAQGVWEPFTCLNSLRDVEPSVKLILRDYGMDREAAEPAASAPATAPTPEAQQP